MTAKQLLFDRGARERILRGVSLLADTVNVTLGPQARTVLLEQPFGPPAVVNSGVVVARSIELADPFENMGVQMVRQVAVRTSEVAGDGTTTATLLAAAIVRAGMKHVAAGMNAMDLKRGIEKAADRAVAALQAMARPCATHREIAQVAAISANNDASVGTLIAEAMGRVGREGVVTVEDIAVLTGATVVLEQAGVSLDKLEPTGFGSAKRVEVDKDTCTIIGGGGDRARIDARIALVKAQLARETGEHERETVRRRIAKLSGGAALVKVGGATETEMKERKLRVYDALHATRAAIAEGVLAGGGVALLRIREAVASTPGANHDEECGVHLLLNALEAPLRQLAENAGVDPSVVLERVGTATGSFGFNAATGEYGDMLAMGVLDPCKVTRSAFQNAVSVADLILTTDCMVAQGSAVGD